MDELTGTVRTFDTARGYGSVESDDGRSWFFHCTQIADGSRTIDVDTRSFSGNHPTGCRVDARVVDYQGSSLRVGDQLGRAALQVTFGYVGCLA